MTNDSGKNLIDSSVHGLKPWKKIASHASALSPLMRAVRVQRFGGLEAIVCEEVSRPGPAEGQVLVRAQAAGVGPRDAAARSHLK
jgi:hypothetical protein